MVADNSASELEKVEVKLKHTHELGDGNGKRVIYSASTASSYASMTAARQTVLNLSQQELN